MAAPMEIPPATKRSTFLAPQKPMTSSGEEADREGAPVSRFRSALRPAFEGQAAGGGQVRHGLGHLGLGTAEPMLEHQRPAPAVVETLQHGVLGLEPDHRRPKPDNVVATAGASPAVRPWVTTGPSEAGFPEPIEEVAEVDDAPSRRDEASVGRSIFRMGHGDGAARHVDGIGHDASRLPGSGAREEVRRIEHDLQPLRRHVGDQLSRVARRGHDIGLFGLDAEIHSDGLGENQRMFHLARQIEPRIGTAVVGMVPPLVVGVARPGAKRHERDPEGAGDRDGDAQAPHARLPHGPVGVDHIVGGRERAQCHARLPCSRGDAIDVGRPTPCRAWRVGRSRPC